MKLRLLIFMGLLVSIVGACHKTAEPEPLPCAGLKTLNGELNVIWTKPSNDLFVMRPAVFGNQVVIGKFVSPTTINLMGIGNFSGLLLWSRLLPVNLGFAGYESAGNKIYYILLVKPINESRELRSRVATVGRSSGICGRVPGGAEGVAARAPAQGARGRALP